MKRGYTTGKIEECLLRQDAHTLHRPSRRRFPRNYYTVNNVGDLWELDLADIVFLASHNDGYKYHFDAIDASPITPTRYRSAPRLARA
jgi:hypothetical protein